MQGSLRGSRRGFALGAALAMAVVLSGCNRNIEPFDPDEQPREPDLSKIFPEGAETAAPAPAVLPPAPGRGAAPLAQEVEAPEASASIAGRVELAPELAGEAPSGAVLFVVARSHGSGGPPLAVKRISSPRFPVEFTIGPDDRMVQAMPFAGPISLSARLDGDGNPMSRTEGDLQGAVEAPVQPGATGVVIRLDSAP